MSARILYMIIALLAIHQVVLELKTESLELAVEDFQRTAQQQAGETGHGSRSGFPPPAQSGNEPTTAAPAAAVPPKPWQCALADMTQGLWNGSLFLPTCAFPKPSYGRVRNRSVVFVGDSNLDALHNAFRILLESPAHLDSMYPATSDPRGPIATCKVTKRPGRCTTAAYYGYKPGNRSSCSKRCGCFTENITCDLSDGGGFVNVEYIAVERVRDREQASEFADTTQGTVLHYLAERRPSIVVFGQGLHSVMFENATDIRAYYPEYMRELLLLMRQSMGRESLFLWHGIAKADFKKSPQENAALDETVQYMNQIAAKMATQQHVGTCATESPPGG
jgi:hypothetical protein